MRFAKGTLCGGLHRNVWRRLRYLGKQRKQVPSKLPRPRMYRSSSSGESDKLWARANRSGLIQSSLPVSGGKGARKEGRKGRKGGKEERRKGGKEERRKGGKGEKTSEKHGFTNAAS